MSEMTTPQGLKPYIEVYRERACTIQRCINRHMASKLAVDPRWIDEYNLLVEIIKNCEG